MVALVLHAAGHVRPGRSVALVRRRLFCVHLAKHRQLYQDLLTRSGRVDINCTSTRLQRLHEPWRLRLGARKSQLRQHALAELHQRNQRHLTTYLYSDSLASASTRRLQSLLQLAGLSFSSPVSTRRSLQLQQLHHQRLVGVHARYSEASVSTTTRSYLHPRLRSLYNSTSTRCRSNFSKWATPPGNDSPIALIHYLRVRHRFN